MIPVCVIKQRLGLCDLWQWCGSRGSAAAGGDAGVLSGVRQTDTEANQPAWYAELQGGLEHTEVIFNFTVWQETNCWLEETYVKGQRWLCLGRTDISNATVL